MGEVYIYMCVYIYIYIYVCVCVCRQTLMNINIYSKLIAHFNKDIYSVSKYTSLYIHACHEQSCLFPDP